MQQAEFLEELLRHRKMLLSFIYSVVRDHHLAEDLFQDVSLVAFNKCADFQSGTNFGAWLRQIARNRIMKEWQKPGKDMLALDDAAIDAVMHAYDREPDEHWEDREAALQECLQRLPPEGRRMIEDRYRDGLAFETIAERLQSTANSIQVRLCKLRQALRRCVEMKLAGKAG
jgi:RNA polymerase sigma-70 factor (ECF subfamily)